MHSGLRRADPNNRLANRSSPGPEVKGEYARRLLPNHSIAPLPPPVLSMSVLPSLRVPPGAHLSCSEALPLLCLESCSCRLYLGPKTRHGLRCGVEIILHRGLKSPVKCSWARGSEEPAHLKNSEEGGGCHSHPFQPQVSTHRGLLWKVCA